MNNSFICDLCGELCKEEIFSIGHFKIGQEADEEVHHFCSEECKRDHEGISEEIAVGIEQGTRREINLIYKMVCPKDQQRLRRLL